MRHIKKVPKYELYQITLNPKSVLINFVICTKQEIACSHTKVF